MSRLRSWFHTAVARLSRRFGRYEIAADAYGYALDAGSDDPDARFQRAWCLILVPERRAQGIVEFQRLLKGSPSASGFQLLGCGLQQEDRHAEAVVAFRESVRLESPGPADLHYNCGVSLRLLRRLDEAVDEFQAAVDAEPTHADAWDALGLTFAEIGRWKDAAPCQLRAIRLAPTLERALNAVPTPLELNRLDEAESALRDALVREPGSTIARYHLVNVLIGQDRYDEALHLARTLCAEDPQAPECRALLAGALSEAGQPDEARREVRALVDIAPDAFWSHCALGGVLVKANDGPGALAAFERALECLGPEAERLPSSDWVWCEAGRGAALSLLGRHDEALAAFQSVLAVDPTFFERWPDVAVHYRRSSDHRS